MSLCCVTSQKAEEVTRHEYTDRHEEKRRRESERETGCKTSQCRSRPLSDRIHPSPVMHYTSPNETSCNETKSTLNGFDAPVNDYNLNDRDDTAVLHARLRHYESFLNDYDYCRDERLKRNAMEKYNLIMQSIQNKSKSRFQYININDDDEDDDDDVGGNNEHNLHRLNQGYSSDRPSSTSVSDGSGGADSKPLNEFPHYNRILLRHRERLKSNNQNSNANKTQ